MVPFVQLRTFLETCRTGSLSRAAAALGITQPAASSHIRTLEDQIGRALFQRHARGVRVTAAGEDLAANVASGFDCIETTFGMTRARAEAIAGTIRIAGPSEFMHGRMVQPIAALNAAGLSVRITLGGREVIYGALASGDVDLAITASRPASDEIGYTIIQEERFSAVASPAWVRRSLDGSRALADALHHPPIAYDVQLARIARLVEAEGRDPAELRPAIVIPDLRILLALVEGGTGWSVFPDYLIEEPLKTGTLVVLDTAKPPIVNQLYLAWTKVALRHPRVAFARQNLLESFGAG